MKKTVCFFTASLLLLAAQIRAESFRALIVGTLEASLENTDAAPVALGYNGSVLVRLGKDTRFFRGVEIELTAPQSWPAYKGSLAMALYAELDSTPPPGAADMEGRRIAFETLPAKIRTVYQIPVRPAHGLKTTPYAGVPAGLTPPSAFPLLFKIMPVIKGLSPELEAMVFYLSAKPVLSDEGAVKFSARYPEQLKGKPFTVLIDDVLIPNLTEEQLLKEGEHHLVVLSEDYRNESRRFVVERGKTLELAVELQDPTPLLIFEGPENARIFLDNAPVLRQGEALPVEPGSHEAKFQFGGYTIVKNLNIQRGKTYRVALAVDINVLESD